MVTEAASLARYLATIGEASDVPARSPSRGPPYWKAPFCAEKRWAPTRSVSRP